MPTSNLEIIRSHGPGVLEVDPGGSVHTPQEWGEFLSSLDVTDASGASYGAIPETFEKHRSERDPRPKWSGDHLWHLDLCREGGSIGQLVTAIYYAEGDRDTPGTDIIDTTRLHTVMQADGVFDTHVPDDDIAARLTTEFSEATYFQQTLPAIAEAAVGPEREEIARFITSRTIAGKPVSIAEYAAYAESRSGASTFPLFTKNPFDLEESTAVMFDAERARDIIDPETNTSYVRLLQAMRQYIGINEPMLREEGIVRTIDPEAGKALFFTREGTLHRAQPGNQSERRIFIGWLATKPRSLSFDPGSNS